VGRNPLQLTNLIEIRTWLQQLDPEVIDTLTARQAELIRTRFLSTNDSFPTYLQIARQEGIHAFTVRSTIERGLRNLRQAEDKLQARPNYASTGRSVSHQGRHR
jgi:DNA-directed RNA polymerase sigma subunit (sigma70/sigma32)